MKTKKELVTEVHGRKVTVPQGTRVTARCADGSERKDGFLFVDDLSFIDARADGLLYHDAYYYGLVVKAEDCE
jgi:hypothetical protein